MAAARPLHLIRGGALLRVRHSRPYATTAWPGPDREVPQRALGSGLLQRRLEPTALKGRAVDDAVDRVVDSHPSRGITRAFLWISRIAQKILKLLARKPCASSPGRSRNSFIAKAEVLPGGNSWNAGETRATGRPGNRHFQLLLPMPGGWPQSASNPGNRCLGVAGPGGAPPTHTRRGPIRISPAAATLRAPGPAAGSRSSHQLPQAAGNNP
jgi:hypothetical protein